MWAVILLNVIHACPMLGSKHYSVWTPCCELHCTKLWATSSAEELATLVSAMSPDSEI